MRQWGLSDVCFTFAFCVRGAPSVEVWCVIGVARHNIETVGSVARAKYKSEVRKNVRVKKGKGGKHAAPRSIEVRRLWECGVTRKQR